MKKYIKIHLIFFIGGLFCSLLSSLFAVILQFFKGEVLDSAGAGQMGNTMKYAVLLMLFILLEVFFYFCFRQFLAKFVVGCTKDLKLDIFKSILCKDYVGYKESAQGRYLAKYTTEADAIKEKYFDMWLSFFEILFKIIFVSIALFLLDIRIAIVTLGLLSTPLYIPKLIEGKLQKAQVTYLEANAENIAKVNDWLSGFEIIKNFSIEHRIIGKFKQSNDCTMNKLLRDVQLGAAAQLITTLISYLSYFIVLVCATWFVICGDFSAGDFFVAIGMIDQLSYPLISLAQIIQHLVAINPACKEMEMFISESENPMKSDLTHFEGQIVFEHVAFGYNNGAAVLDDVNFNLQKGKRYLFCGPSGCGKTTAINLLLRYFEVNNGRILFDGIDASEYTNTYGCITILRQDAILFHDTLRNNLSMYRDMDDCILIELLLKVGLDKYANREALDNVVTENGSNLSGGERKRICLARALLRNTDILILDEPLANLDDESARRIEELVLSIPDKTMIVVSHQFSEGQRHHFDAVYDFGKPQNVPA